MSEAPHSRASPSWNALATVPKTSSAIHVVHEALASYQIGQAIITSTHSSSILTVPIISERQAITADLAATGYQSNPSRNQSTC